MDDCSIFYNIKTFEFVSFKDIFLNHLLSSFTEQELSYLTTKKLQPTDGGETSDEYNKSFANFKEQKLSISLCHINT